MIRWRQIDNEIERLLESVEDQLTLIQEKVELIDEQVSLQGNLTKKILSKAKKNEGEIKDVNQKLGVLENHLSDPAKVCCDFILIVLTIMLLVMLIAEIGKL